jgi:hypothetical protein
LVSLAVFGAVLLVASPATANTASDPGFKDDTKCLKCHSRKREKSLEDGNVLSLHVSVEEYASSVHSEIGCTSCHKAIAGKKHPSREPIANRHDYSLALNQSCRDCHAESFEQYEGSIHASLVAGGNHSAPVCTDCHSAHAVESVAVYQPVTGFPCKNCHENIFDAYAQSVHGGARANENVIRASHIQAPICADCHQAHAVTPVALNGHLQSTCLNCHDGATLAHEQWLPNAGLHLDVVSCAACHAPLAERRVNLSLYDKISHTPVGLGDGYAEFEKQLRAVDEAGDGLDPVELWKLVRASGQGGNATEITLRGRLEVSTGPQAHRLAVKTSAVRDCDSCHQSGSGAFQNVTITVTNPDGTRANFEADEKILSSVVSMDSVSDFYVLGGTRIKLFDVLLVLSLIGGLAIPLGHYTLGKVLRKGEEGDH